MQQVLLKVSPICYIPAQYSSLKLLPRKSLILKEKKFKQLESFVKMFWSSYQIFDDHDDEPKRVWELASEARKKF